MMHDLIIHNEWALGDTVCLSALFRDIQTVYPGQYRLHMAGHYRNVFWNNNPNVVIAGDPLPQGQLVSLKYADGIQAAGRGELVHFLSWFHRSFRNVTGIDVPVLKPHGDIHLSAHERRNHPPGRYWVVVAGGKADLTCKIWSADYWQQTVNMLKDRGIQCVQAGGTFSWHFHPKLENVTQLVGETQNERDFFSLIAGAEGVICGVTAAMHIAAVFHKPCVVLAGGREEPWWEHYNTSATFGTQCEQVKVPHRFLHTVGALDCGIGNTKKGCWRNKTFKSPVFERYGRGVPTFCALPVTVANQTIPKCLAMITPSIVVDAVESYYADGTLPPVI